MCREEREIVVQGVALRSQIQLIIVDQRRFLPSEKILQPACVVVSYYDCIREIPSFLDFGGSMGTLGNLIASKKTTPCHIPTYIGIPVDNLNCDLSRDILA